MSTTANWGDLFRIDSADVQEAKKKLEDYYEAAGRTFINWETTPECVEAMRITNGLIVTQRGWGCVIALATELLRCETIGSETIQAIVGRYY